MSTGLLTCSISPGQFTGEYSVTAKMFDGETFSLFANEPELRCESFPEKGETVQGEMLVEILDKGEGLLLVRLPQRALENGDTVTVRENDVLSC